MREAVPRGLRRAAAGVALCVAGVSAARGAAPAHGAPPIQSEPDSASVTPAMVAAGRAIFHGKGTCFACHGMQLEGSQVAPTLKPHKWRDAKDGDFPQIYHVVTHGVPGTLMVAFPGGITRAEAANVVSYVWSVTRGKVKP
jgi:mono/diheme cytochrome c family protein